MVEGKLQQEGEVIYVIVNTVMIFQNSYAPLLQLKKKIRRC